MRRARGNRAGRVGPSCIRREGVLGGMVHRRPSLANGYAVISEPHHSAQISAGKPGRPKPDEHQADGQGQEPRFGNQTMPKRITVNQPVPG